jgi:hypothetical protein
MSLIPMVTMLPDGIVGPYHEKEGSYYAIKEIWCPVHLEPREITPAFNGNLRLENRYSYTNLKQCTFSYKLAKFNNPWQQPQPQKLKPDRYFAGCCSPVSTATCNLHLPKNWQNYDVLYITPIDPYKKELFTWSFPIKMPHD